LYLESECICWYRTGRTGCIVKGWICASVSSGHWVRSGGVVGWGVGVEIMNSLCAHNWCCGNLQDFVGFSDGTCPLGQIRVARFQALYNELVAEGKLAAVKDLLLGHSASFKDSSNCRLTRVKKNSWNHSAKGVDACNIIEGSFLS
jgi:hypothetical protein